MKSQKPAILIDSLPSVFTRALAGYSSQCFTGGYSTAEVFRLEAPGRPCLYLKTAPRTPAGELRAERQRLEWIGTRLPVPRVHHYTEDTEREYLLTSEIPGIDATHPIHQQDTERLVRLLAEGMRLIHSLPREDCPFDQRLEIKIRAARDRMLRGLVDEEDFDEERQGRTAADLFEELIRTRPADEDLVFTHGDYCLPNVILDQGRLSGFIDWGSAGIADRYQDLALAARSFTHNTGAGDIALLFDDYGIPEPDPARIEFYKLLDEFF